MTKNRNMAAPQYSCIWLFVFFSLFVFPFYFLQFTFFYVKTVFVFAMSCRTLFCMSLVTKNEPMPARVSGQMYEEFPPNYEEFPPFYGSNYEEFPPFLKNYFTLIRITLRFTHNLNLWQIIHYLLNCNQTL